MVLQNPRYLTGQYIQKGDRVFSRHKLHSKYPIVKPFELAKEYSVFFIKLKKLMIDRTIIYIGEDVDNLYSAMVIDLIFNGAK